MDGETPVCRSGRHEVGADGASATDEDSLKKAMHRKAAYNLDTCVMKQSSKFLLSLSSQSIKANLNNVGISMSNNRNDIDVSTRVLKLMEFDRLTVIPKVSTVLDTTYQDDEEANARTDGQLLSHLVGEVSEIGLDENGLYSLYELKASGRKSKSSSNKKPRKRSKYSKSPIVSQ
jgi:hypothetical protein